jgi:hypothetical protein
MPFEQTLRGFHHAIHRQTLQQNFGRGPGSQIHAKSPERRRELAPMRRGQLTEKGVGLLKRDRACVGG